MCVGEIRLLCSRDTSRNNMAETGMIVPLVISFIVVSILLLIGTSILGGVTTGFDCKTLEGYNESGSDNAAKYPTGTWSGTCFAVGTASQNAYSLLLVVLIIISAAVILYVVRTFA